MCHRRNEGEKAEPYHECEPKKEWVAAQIPVDGGDYEGGADDSDCAEDRVEFAGAALRLVGSRYRTGDEDARAQDAKGYDEKQYVCYRGNVLPQRYDKAEDAERPAKECELHEPPIAANLVLADHTPGGVIFRLQEMQEDEEYGECGRSQQGDHWSCLNHNTILSL